MAYTLNDISQIKLTVRTSSSTVVGYFSNLRRCYSAFRAWNAPTCDPHPLTSIIITIGESDDGAPGKTVGGIIQPRTLTEYSDFLSEISRIFHANSIAIHLNNNRPARMQMHNGGSAIDVTITRKNPRKKHLDWRDYSFVKKMWSSKAILAELLVIYDWAFGFSSVDNMTEYRYHDELSVIHNELLHLATSHQLHAHIDYPGVMPGYPGIKLAQADALKGLHRFYEMYPEWTDRLSDYYIQKIIWVALGNTDYWVNRESKNLITVIGQQKTEKLVELVMNDIRRRVDDIRAQFNSGMLDTSETYRSKFVPHVIPGMSK